MNVTEFYYLEDGLFFGFLVAVGLSLNRPEYRVARRFAWAAATMFGSTAIVWAVSESAWIRILAVAIAGMIAAIPLTEALTLGKKWQFPTQSSSVSSSAPAREPTPEATSTSVADATGAAVPGDLPYQSGRDESNSVTPMPSIRVTNTITDGRSPQ